ncbi:hypothetical protein [Amycolatopsis saalfeldensis]|uniref:hypothetical protein n=1 Tax=Amycolatopsis saalfeldensis TaxID=394193 RepID=UPI0015A568F3|nr:hypothetical protein [Amycolatopsis saalfeldensis]
MTNQSHHRLPAPVRHHRDLAPGGRVLLAAHPDRARLVVHPPALDDMPRSSAVIPHDNPTFPQPRHRPIWTPRGRCCPGWAQRRKAS